MNPTVPHRLALLVLAAALGLLPAMALGQTTPKPAQGQRQDPVEEPMRETETRRETTRPGPSANPAVPPAVALPSGPGSGRAEAAPSLAGILAESPGWPTYRARFVTAQGRVVDTANGSISHSEGQGYGMLLAVAADDRATFERIWGWTRANLMVRSDALLAWRWAPDQRPAVGDLNDATDGDLLVAWALTEAAEAWGESAYRTAARRIAVEVGRKAMLFKDPHGALLLPAVAGFSAADRPDGPLVNLSYWVFPAFQRLGLVAPEYDWQGLIRSGLDLLRQARFGPSRLPTEWISLKAEPRPADGFPALFSYNAIRVPLYLAWAGIGREADYAPFVTLWSGAAQDRLPIVDTRDGRAVEWLSEKGYASLSSLVDCAAAGKAVPADFETVRDSENYYPTTLQLLSMVAVRMRYASCLKR